MLLFTIGLARSGKSTWANKWLNTETVKVGVLKNSTNDAIIKEISVFDRIGKPRVVVSGDDIRLALSGQRYNSHMEEYIFAMEHTMIKALLARGHDVLADDTHTTWKSIQALLQIDPHAIPIWHPGDQYGRPLYKIPSKEWTEH